MNAKHFAVINNGDSPKVLAAKDLTPTLPSIKLE